MPSVPLPVTGDPHADRLLARDPFALLLGMLLDQQVPMEWAFRGPATLRDRLGHLDPTRIAIMPEEELEAAFRHRPALHRYPGAMARRAGALARHVAERYGGDAGRIWRGAPDAATVLDRLRALPGYGDEKAKILLAVLGKRFRSAPAGWEAAAAPFSDGEPRSVADVDSREALERVRAWKQARKAAGRTKAD